MQKKVYERYIKVYMNMHRKRIENCDAHFTTQTWQKWFVTHAGKSQWRV